MTIGARTFFLRVDNVVPLDELEDAESQTWNWPEAAALTPSLPAKGRFSLDLSPTSVTLRD